MNRHTFPTFPTRMLMVTALATGCMTSPPPNDAAVPMIDVGPPDASLGSPQIVLRNGGSLVAVAGDVIQLEVVMVSPAGVHSPLPTGAVVTWNAPPVLIALASGSTPTVSNLPRPGLAPSGFFLQNREHYTDAQLAGYLLVTDAGSIAGGVIGVDAHVAATGIDANVSASIPVGPVPSGDPASGQTYYAGNCAMCHGARGEGGIAPGLNHAGGNVVADPAWNASLFASVPRADLDNLGVSQGPGMPAWLVAPTPSGAPLRTQDMVDVYAWLLTQN